MRKLSMKGQTVAWPVACACCLGRASRVLKTERTKKLFLGVVTFRRTLSLEVPYCEACAGHVPWFDGSRTKGTLLMAWAAFMMAIPFLSGPVGIVWVVWPKPLHANPVVASILTLIFLAGMLGFPVIAAAATVWLRSFGKPNPPANPPHVRPGHGVEITDFGKDDAVLIVHNDAYAAKVISANPATMSPGQ